MNLEYFLARKLGGVRNGVGRSSNRIATMSIAASIAIIIVAVAICEGFNEEIRQKTSGYTGDIVLSPIGVPIDNHNSYPVSPLSCLDELTHIAGVKSAYPVIYSPAVLKTVSGMDGVMFKGVGPEYDMSFFEHCLDSGTASVYNETSIPDSENTGSGSESVFGTIASGKPKALISRTLADLLNLEAGSGLMAYFVTADGTVKIRKFDIVGIFNAQLENMDKSLVITDSRTIESVNGWKSGECSGYEVFLESRNISNSRLDHICSRIDELLFRSETNNEFSLQPVPLKDIYWVFFDWLRLVDINVVIILVLMIAVAGFNIISGLLIIIFEHISTIGLFKALGMSDRCIFKVFMYRSLGMVGRGVLWGNIISISFCLLQASTHFIGLDPSNYLIDHVPVHLTLAMVLITNLSCVAAILLIMLIPSKAISSVDPAQALTVK